MKWLVVGFFIVIAVIAANAPRIYTAVMFNHYITNARENLAHFDKPSNKRGGIIADVQHLRLAGENLLLAADYGQPGNEVEDVAEKLKAITQAQNENIADTVNRKIFEPQDRFFDRFREFAERRRKIKF